MKVLELNQMEVIEGGGWNNSFNCKSNLIFGAIGLGLAFFGPLGWLTIVTIAVSSATMGLTLMTECITVKV